MDVARPLTVLVPSLDGPVLEALARTSRPVTGREAHRLAGAGSESGVRLVLARLVEHGLVNATQAGKATLYVANREHIAWPLVEGLVNLRRELFARMGKLIAAWSSPPATVTVFGSAARGDGGLDSDIDVLVVGGADRADVYEAADRAQARLGMEVNPVVRSAEQWDNAADGLAAQIKAAAYTVVLDRREPGGA